MDSKKLKSIVLIVITVLVMALGCGYFCAPQETRERIAATMQRINENAYRLFGGSKISSYFYSVTGRKAGAGDKDKKDKKGKGDGKQAAPVATLIGHIYDETGVPITDASVTIMGLIKDKTFSGKSDKTGSYKVEKIPEGNGNIVVRHPKYVAMMRPGYPFTVNTTSTVDIKLPIASKITGRVLDEDRKPINNVKVEARHISNTVSASGGEAIIFADVSKEFTSDRDGKYTLSGVPLGENELSAQRAGYEKLLQKHVVTRENAESSLDLILKKAGVLTGEVRDENGKGLPGAKITLTKFKPFGEVYINLPETSNTVMSKQDGKFGFEKLFSEGFYDLKVEHPSYAPVFLNLIPIGTENIVVNMNFGATIAGNAILIDRAGKPGAAVPVKIEAVIKETTFTQKMVSDNGVFKFTRLPFGTYKIWVDDAPYACLPHTPVPCELAKPVTDNITVEVYQVCPVSGRVTSAENGMPIGDATVTIDSIFGSDKQRTLKFTATTSQMGKFVFDKLPAGQHTAAADAKGFIRTNSGTSAETFFLLPGEAKNDLSLLLYKGGTVEGRVLSANGSVVVGADVQLYVASTNKRSLDTRKLQAKTGDNGWYKVTGIDVGEQLQLYGSARANGHAKGVSSIINLTDTEPTAIADIQLMAGGSIQGRVMDENSLPIKEAQVSWSSGNFPGDPSPSGDKVATEANGTYIIENLPPGSIYLNVSRSGYVGQGRSVTVANKQAVAGIDFKLKTGKTITGLVMTVEGNPIPDANVAATGLSGTQGNNSARTDKEGRFNLTNLGEGTFRLNATFSLATPEGGQGYNFYVYPIKSGSEGVMIECDVDNNASTIVSASGSMVKIQNFSFTLRANSNVRGQDFSMNVSRGVNNTNGLLKVSKIPRGVYTLEVRAEGYETWKDEDVYIGPNSKTSMPPVHLEASGGVMGKVTSNKTSRPVNGVSVSVYELTDATQNTSDNSQGWTRITGTSTNYSGEFRVNGLSPGTYRVDCSHSNYSAQSIKNIAVSRRKYTDIGTIVLETGGTVTGTITDETGAPCQGFTVTVTDTNPQRKATTDRGGNYLMQGLSEGSHQISVQGAVRGWRPTYTPGSVTIIAGESVSKNFTIGLTANAKGSVISPIGGNINGTICFYPFNELGNVIDWIHYDANISGGAFTLNQVPPGKYFMFATGSASGYPYRLWDIVTLSQGDNNMSLPLSPSIISGIAANSEGHGTAGISIQLRPVFDASYLTSALYNRLILNSSTKSNGTFTLRFMQSGSYQIMYMNSQGQWVAQQPLSIGYGQQFSNITLPMQ